MFMRIDAIKVVSLAVFTAAATSAAVAQPKPGEGSGATPAPAPAPTPAPAPAGGTEPAPPAPDGPDDSPTAIKLRALEQKVQALKERAWRAKARVGILKEDAIGGGIGASAMVVHHNKMGSPFRVTKLVYAIDGAQLFVRNDETGETLYKTKSFEIINGPVAPGSHTLSVIAVYKGHGIGPFKYLDKYNFTVQASHSFTVEEGKGIKVECNGYEKGGAKTPLEKRPHIDCTNVVVAGK